jgi:hypothetical protein
VNNVKERYENAAMEIVEFEAEDVIRTSYDGGDDTEDDPAE